MFTVLWYFVCDGDVTVNIYDPKKMDRNLY